MGPTRELLEQSRAAQDMHRPKLCPKLPRTPGTLAGCPCSPGRACSCCPQSPPARGADLGLGRELLLELGHAWPCCGAGDLVSWVGPMPLCKGCGCAVAHEGCVRAGGARCCPSVVSPLQAWKGLQGTFRAPRGQHKGLLTHPRASLVPAAVSWLCRAVGACRMPPAVPLPNGFTRNPPATCTSLGLAGLLLAGPSAARRDGLGKLTGGHCRGLSQQLPAAPQTILWSRPSVPPRLKCSGGTRTPHSQGVWFWACAPTGGCRRRGVWGNADPLPDRCPSRPVPWATPLLLGPGGTCPGPPAGMGMGGGQGTCC